MEQEYERAHGCAGEAEFRDHDPAARLAKCRNPGTRSVLPNCAQRIIPECIGGFGLRQRAQERPHALQFPVIVRTPPAFGDMATNSRGAPSSKTAVDEVRKALVASLAVHRYPSSEPHGHGSKPHIVLQSLFQNGSPTV